MGAEARCAAIAGRAAGRSRPDLQERRRAVAMARLPVGATARLFAGIGFRNPRVGAPVLRKRVALREASAGRTTVRVRAVLRRTTGLI